MTDVVVGLLALAVGALFCFRGYLTMRLVIPVWGAFTGFLFGAALVSGITGNRFLAGALSWIVGAAVALVFAVLAYVYYEVSVVLAMAAVGFVLGATAMVALHATWTWVVVLAGILTGLALAVVAIVADLPMLLLVLLTATAGGATLVAGCMLLAGSLNTADVTSPRVVQQIHDSPGWWVLYAVVSVVGIVLQTRATEAMRRSLRDQWAADGGHQLVSRPTAATAEGPMASSRR